MVHVNENFLKLKAGYLFPEIARRVTAFCESSPEANVIRLGIGDVTEPLPPAARKNAPPVTLSPGPGSLAPRTTRSTLTEPRTTRAGLAVVADGVLPDGAMGLGGRREGLLPERGRGEGAVVASS